MDPYIIRKELELITNDEINMMAQLSDFGTCLRINKDEFYVSTMK